MTTVRVRLPKEQVDRLNDIAKGQGKSVGVLIHETIMHLIERNESPTETAEDMENEHGTKR